MSHATITQFYRFLDSIGLFGEFWSEYYKIRDGRRRTFNEYEAFLKLSPETYVSSAFPWNSTTSGAMFWRSIHYRWLRRIGCNDQK